MTDEQKAKRYDEAIERARCYYTGANGNENMITMTTTIFPELTENEDERIRKELIWGFKHLPEETFAGIPVNDVISWIEKQGEQKPAWSEEDKEIITGLANYVGCHCPEGFNEWYVWLKSLKGRVQPKQEWSEEDESMRIRTLGALGAFKIECNKSNVDAEMEWLKSLRPQNHWKPTEEQMEALNAINVTGCISYSGQGQKLINLYNDLKNLK